jgi:hypothetical protein
MKKISVSYDINNPQAYDKVRAIKAIRILTLKGLKEAKDIIDAAHTGPVDVVIDTSEAAQARYTEYATSVDLQIDEIRRAGYTVSQDTTTQRVVTELKNMVSMTVEDGNYDLAVDLIEVLRRHGK